MKASRAEHTVTGVCVDSLEQTKRDPDVDGDDVEILAEPAVKQGAGDGARAEDHDFRGVRVLRSKTERRRVFVVNLVNVLVERAPVQRLVREEVEHVLEDEEQCDLGGQLAQAGEGHLPCGHAARLSERVEEPDLGGRC